MGLTIPWPSEQELRERKLATQSGPDLPSLSSLVSFAGMEAKALIKATVSASRGGSETVIDICYTVSLAFMSLCLTEQLITLLDQILLCDWTHVLTHFFISLLTKCTWS